MDHYGNLEPNIRSQALVGSFLQEWGLVESRLNDVIVKSLGFDNLGGLIVVKNIQFRDKIKIAKSAVQVLYSFADDVDVYRKVLDDISAFSSKRNIVAHELFLSNENGDVEFLVIRANGDLKFPREIWSIELFYDYFSKMRKFSSDLSSLVLNIQRADLMKALAARTETNFGSFLALLGLQGDGDRQWKSEREPVPSPSAADE